MKTYVRHPSTLLAALAIASGLLGSNIQGPGFGNAPQLGLYMVLTGVWFGLVVGFGVWRLGSRSWVAAATAFVTTWAAWEAAVNVALQLDAHWLEAIKMPGALRFYVSGCVAGAVGACVTWAGAAAFTPALRQKSLAVGTVAAGALLGLLLPFTSRYDNPAILLLPWQAAVAAILGSGFADPQPEQHRHVAASIAARCRPP